jgi:hypothetical protein
VSGRKNTSRGGPAVFYGERDDDAEEQDDDGAENVSQEEDISEPQPASSEPPPVSGPTPARKSTKKANGRGAVGEKVKRVVSREQKDRNKEAAQKTRRLASKSGQGNAGGDKRPEFFINKEALKGITGQALSIGNRILSMRS